MGKVLSIIVSLTVLIVYLFSPKTAFAEIVDGVCTGVPGNPSFPCTCSCPDSAVPVSICFPSGFTCGTTCQCETSLPPSTCVAARPYPFCGTPPPGRDCEASGTCASGEVQYCCAPLPTPPPSGDGNKNTWRPPECKIGSSTYPAISTAIGCIPTEPSEFITQLTSILLKLGGGIAFLLMIIGAVFVLTSRGNPEAVNRGKEVFVGALVGLLLLIFSTFILELIGVDVLGLF